MANFAIYFDASGSPDSTTILSVAGFIAPTTQWIHFERDWKAALQEFGVSELHMRNFAHSLGEYAGWKGDEERRRRFLSRLIAEIRVRVRHSFVTSIYLPDYYENDKKYCVSETIKPFALAGGGCIRRVLAWADRWKIAHDEITFFFEDGDKDKGNLIDTAKTFGVTPVFIKKSQSVALQAADLLAYEHFLANKKVVKSPGVYALDDLRRPLRALFEIPNGDDSEDWSIMENPQMEQNFKDLPLRHSEPG